MYGSLYDEQNTPLYTTGKRGILEKDGYYLTITNDPDSYHLFLDEESVRKKYFYPYLEKEQKILDIGCGVGSYALPALAKGCIVFAICPPSDYSNTFKKNLEVNDFKCKLIEKAVYSEDGYINPMSREFFAKKELIPLYYQKREMNFMNQVDYFYECSTVDKLFKSDVDFIKIDVEGLEEEVIRGAENTIKKNMPILLVENHLFKDPGIEKRIVDLIINVWQLDYDFYSAPYSNTASTFFYSHTLFTPIT